MPNELWTEVRDIVQETGIKTIPMEKKCKKCKMAVWGGLTNSWEKKRSEKQGEKEKYKHLNAEFQRIARRDKKAFLSDQRKEVEENNRMGKTRDLFKKIRDTEETFACTIMAGYSLWSHKESDITEQLDTFTHHCSHNTIASFHSELLPQPVSAVLFPKSSSQILHFRPSRFFSIG